MKWNLYKFYIFTSFIMINKLNLPSIILDYILLFRFYYENNFFLYLNLLSKYFLSK